MVNSIPNLPSFQVIKSHGVYALMDRRFQVYALMDSLRLNQVGPTGPVSTNQNVGRFQRLRGFKTGRLIFSWGG